MPVHDAPPISRRTLIPALVFAIVLPILSFYAYLFYMSRNIPLTDDYDAGLNFANHLV